MGKGPFKMTGHTLPGPNQKSPNKVWAAVAGMAMKKKNEMADNIGTMLNPPKTEEEPKNNVKFSD